jgi:tetratricopeptide (TPR) repeat protein
LRRGSFFSRRRWPPLRARGPFPIAFAVSSGFLKISCQVQLGGGCAPQLTAAEPASAGKPALLHFFLFGRTWCLDLDLTAFDPPEFEFTPDLKTAHLSATNEATGYMITAAVNPATNANSTAAERNGMIARLRHEGFKLKDLKTYEQGDRAFLEYTLRDLPKELPNLEGFTQRNGFAFIAHDGFWIDVHISCTGFKKTDADRISAFISSLSLNRSFRPLSFDIWLPGMLLYRGKDYPAVIAWLTQALEWDTREPSLARDQRLAATDNLGMAYGICGMLQKAREVFTTAITEHPEYPMFYYNLACTEAEDGNLDAALKSLRLTLEHKGNMIRGEKLPDPMTDDSFKKYLDDPCFREVARGFLEPSAL